MYYNPILTITDEAQAALFKDPVRVLSALFFFHSLHFCVILFVGLHLLEQEQSYLVANPIQ